MNTAHQQRIKQELRAAGISGYALRKAEGRYLPQLVREDEHIMAAIYGRTDRGSAMLVATDRRVLFVDKKPFMTMSDEISYEVVGGVGISQEAGLFVSVVLHTRMGDYAVRFVNPQSAKTFEHYIGKVRLEGSPKPDTRRTDPVTARPRHDTHQRALIDAAATSFLESHHIGVLSTIDRTGQLHGSAMYYVYDSATTALYVLTKSDTKKAHNILATHHVAFTVYDEPKRQTAQIQAVANIEADQQTKQMVFDAISSPKQYETGESYPPVAKIKAGGYIVFRLEPTHITYSNYSER
jgi:general stress protein 26